MVSVLAFGVDVQLLSSLFYCCCCCLPQCVCFNLWAVDLLYLRQNQVCMPDKCLCTRGDVVFQVGGRLACWLPLVSIEVDAHTIALILLLFVLINFMASQSAGWALIMLYESSRR